MRNKNLFVRRAKYFNKIEKYILAQPSDLDGPVMLIVGEEGMGKTALLQGTANELSEMGHIMVFGELDKNNSSFSDQIYPLIAQIKIQKKIRLGSNGDWLKAFFSVFGFVADTILTGGAASGLKAAGELGKVLGEIKNQHNQNGYSSESLVALFHAALTEREQKLNEGERIIVFLDPVKETPLDMIPFLRRLISFGLPRKARIVIAQRKDDALIQAHKKGEVEEVFDSPINLEPMSDNEKARFINLYDDGPKKLSDQVRQALINRYRGWPLLLYQAITDLQKRKGAISVENVEELPISIQGFWERRYSCIQDENTLRVFHTICLLPHPYPKSKLANFSGLSHSAINAVFNNKSLWNLLGVVDFVDPLSFQYWECCPYPKHTTVKDYAKLVIDNDEGLKNELVDTIKVYYKKIIDYSLTTSEVDKDALVYLPHILFQNNLINDFQHEVAMLTDIKLKHGLLDSFKFDQNLILGLSKKQNYNEGTANSYGNLGIVCEMRGDYIEANKFYQLALEHAHKIDEEQSRYKALANQYTNTGNIYSKSSNPIKGLEMQKNALVNAEKITDELSRKEALAIIYANYGGALACNDRKVQVIEEGLKMIKFASVLNEELDRQEAVIKNYKLMAEIYSALGNTYKKEELLQKAEALSNGIVR